MEAGPAARIGMDNRVVDFVRGLGACDDVLAYDDLENVARVPSVYVENHRVRDLDPNDPLWVGRKKPSPDHPTGHRYVVSGRSGRSVPPWRGVQMPFFSKNRNSAR